MSSIPLTNLRKRFPASLWQVFAVTSAFAGASIGYCFDPPAAIAVEPKSFQSPDNSQTDSSPNITPASISLTVRKTERSFEIMNGDKLVTAYQFRSGSKPIFWPILGPKGNSFTRDYPMVPDSKDEKHDHPHHRGLWMNFGDINGHDLWAEGNGKGTICHAEQPTYSQSGGKVIINAKHLWRGGLPGVNSVSENISFDGDPKTPVLATCDTKYIVAADENGSTIDCYYRIQAEQDLHFGDTKEGMFAIRVPEPMKVDNKNGHILSSEGLTDGATWGFPARWVDYSGPTRTGDEAIHGIAILVHPESFHAAGRWHVRTYGLFAHNAFGSADFPAISDENRPKDEGLQNPPQPGGFKLPKGKSITMAYRVVFHPGAWKLEDGNKAFNEFKKEPIPFR